MNSEKISAIVLAVLVAIAAIVCVMFCVGGSEEAIYSGEAFDAPNYTGAVLNVVYAFFFLAIAATVISAILSFFIKFNHAAFVKSFKRHFNHAHCSVNYHLSCIDNSRSLLSLEHYSCDLRSISQVSDAGFDYFDACHRYFFLDLFLDPCRYYFR